MGEIDYLRERESGAAVRHGDASGRNAAADERNWPLGISLLIAVMVSLILWAGIIIFLLRLWRWI